MSEEEKEFADAAYGIAQTVIVCSVSVAVLAASISKFGLEYILSAWGNLQTVIHVFLMNIFIPATGESFTLKLLQSIKVELVDTKTITIAILGVVENGPMNAHYEASGYENSDFVLNIGPLLYLIALALLLMVFNFGLSKCHCLGRI